nr:uncharacterized protein LOC104648303 [Solanum lycopersicum]
MRMNRNLEILDDDHNPEIPPSIDAHDQLLHENHEEGEIHRQPPAPRFQEYYRGYHNITDSNGPLVLPPLPHGHTFVVTNSLMQMLTVRGLFSGLPSEDPHAHIAKVSRPSPPPPRLPLLPSLSLSSPPFSALSPSFSASLSPSHLSSPPLSSSTRKQQQLSETASCRKLQRATNAPPAKPAAAGSHRASPLRYPPPPLFSNRLWQQLETRIIIEQQELRFKKFHSIGRRIFFSSIWVLDLKFKMMKSGLEEFSDKALFILNLCIFSSVIFIAIYV